MIAQKVLTRKIKWEVDASQHDRKENVPSKDTSNERESASGFLTLCSDCCVALGRVEKGSRKETERGYKREEDEEEDQVGADGADEVDKTQYAHADHEVT
jgi:hypothetical protein